MTQRCHRDSLGVCQYAEPHYVWAHNPAAWVGIALCVLLLLLWLDRNAVYLRERIRSWEDE